MRNVSDIFVEKNKKVYILRSIIFFPKIRPFMRKKLKNVVEKDRPQMTM